MNEEKNSHLHKFLLKVVKFINKNRILPKKGKHRGFQKIKINHKMAYGGNDVRFEYGKLQNLPQLACKCS